MKGCCSFLLLAVALTLPNRVHAAAETPLRLDFTPTEFTGPDGAYQPRRGPITIPDVPREERIGFCLYTTHEGLLKLSAQLYPLEADEAHEVRLEIEDDEGWRERARAPVDPASWNAVFRIGDWDETQSRRYRVRHAGGSVYEGRIRANPREKDEVVVAFFTGNSNSDRNPRRDIIANVRAQNPDLLFFSGDQSYDHRDHTAAWLLFGRQFGDLLRDCPAVTIPDDHDVGQGNLWGAGGDVSRAPGGDDGGYIMPADYVNLVQQQQCSHLPDPFDPTPVKQGITVYYTSLNVGGIDFAILEDRKWKTGPKGLIPQQGPRADHVTDPDYDPEALDVPEAQLLGARQLAFLRAWGQDWDGVVMKAVLSQTIFGGGAHLHGSRTNRLLVDLDSNGWPQAGRARALREIRRCFGFMMGGDQHLATLIHHGINDWEDAGWSFCCPSIWNYYGRWWSPLEAPLNHEPDNPLQFTGRYFDGLRNKLTLYAYANPEPGNHRAAGYGLVRFRKSTREITMECWPRFVDVTRPGATQFPGWPRTIHQEDNYGRRALGWLPRLEINREDTLVQVVDETDGEIAYTLRIRGRTWTPKVFRAGSYTLRITHQAEQRQIRGVQSSPEQSGRTLQVQF